MAKKTITEFEDELAEAKKEFYKIFVETLEIIEKQGTPEDVQKILTDLHSKGVNFFNLFERSINEYGLDYFKLNDEIRIRKIEDSVAILNTVVNYWQLLNSISTKYNILTPKPSVGAYSSIQRLVKTFIPEKVQDLKTKFMDNNLPTEGFDSSKRYTGWNKKHQITYGIITGTILLMFLLIITIVIECPTNSQNRTFSIILALASAAFSASIPGFLNVKYKEVITAGGALAVFVIIFLLKPAEISDFKSCSEKSNISGTVYFGSNPTESIELRFIRQNQLTNTDAFGNFNLPIDIYAINENLRVQLRNSTLKLDTIISINKSELEKPLEIYIPSYCVNCTMKDSSNLIINNKIECSASLKYIEDYIRGFTEAGQERGLTVDCIKN